MTEQQITHEFAKHVLKEGVVLNMGDISNIIDFAIFIHNTTLQDAVDSARMTTEKTPYFDTELNIEIPLETTTIYPDSILKLKISK